MLECVCLLQHERGLIQSSVIEITEIGHHLSVGSLLLLYDAFTSSSTRGLNFC